jgi:hypothetical protein
MPNLGQIKEKSAIIILFTIFLFSFILDMYLLTRYNLSYGRDGPFYDLQVLNIIQTGFPASNDPPLVYYMLTPFVLITGNSFLGIKIAMALFGSLMVFPAFFLTEIFNKNGSKIPAILSAFLITVNVSYFAMIGDFMQNLVGVLFLLLLMYFTVKWLEDTRNWKKYGTVVLLLLVCSILTHIYTGMLAVVIFLAIILFNTCFKAIKTRKLPLFDLKILGIIGAFIVAGLVFMFTIYPVMFLKVATVVSFFNGTSNNAINSLPASSTDITVFLTLPFLLGLFATIKIFYTGLKTKNLKNRGINGKDNFASNNSDPYLTNVGVLSKKTLLSSIYLIMAFVLILLAAVPSEYQSRFILLAFVPIALIVPVGLQLIESLIYKKYPSRNFIKIGLITIIAILFAFSSLYTASEEFSNMGPSISSEQYNALLKIKTDYIGDEIGSNNVIVVNEYHMGYWVQYVLGMEVVTGNTNETLTNSLNSSVYQIKITENQFKSSHSSSKYLWNPLLPYSFPVGFDFNPSSSPPNGLNGQSQSPGSLHRNVSNVNPTNGSDDPPGMENNSNTTKIFRGNITGNNSFDSPPEGMGNVSNIPGNFRALTSNRETFSQGTLIFSLNNVKIYKIS